MRFQIYTGKAELREVKLLAKGKQLVRYSGIPHWDVISCQKPFQLPRILLIIVNISWIYPKPQDFTFITNHIHTWVLFLLWLHLFILFGVISLLISRSILGTYRRGEIICQFPIFLPFHTVHGVLRQEYWSGFPFPSPVDHVLSELSTITCPSWVVLHGMAHSFTELDKAVVHVIRLVSFLWLVFSLSALWWRRVRGLWKLPDARHWLRGKFGLVLMGGAMIRWIIEKATVPKKHLLLLYWLRQSVWLCGSQQTVDSYSQDGNTRPSDLSPEKSVCRSRSNS